MNHIVIHENDDERIINIARRLGVLKGLLGTGKKQVSVYVVVKDGKFVRVLMRFVGHADPRDNGFVMFSTLDAPGAADFIHSLVPGNYAEAPAKMEVRKP